MLVGEVSPWAATSAKALVQSVPGSRVGNGKVVSGAAMEGPEIREAGVAGLEGLDCAGFVGQHWESGFPSGRTGVPAGALSKEVTWFDYAKLLPALGALPSPSNVLSPDFFMADFSLFRNQLTLSLTTSRSQSYYLF